jgi:starch phosphorylase
MPKPSNVLSHPAESADIAAFRAAVLDKLAYSFGKTPDIAGLNDWYMSTALALRDRIVERWLKTGQRPEVKGGKRVYYLSIEYLLGQLLFDALINMRLLNVARAALADLDVDIDQLRKLEPDAALGNGGLGRLAACYMDSMAALAVPAYGYGIRYENGLFVQQIRDGWQIELPERWLAQPLGVRAHRYRIFDLLRRQRRICRRRSRQRHGARAVVPRRTRARGGL